MNFNMVLTWSQWDNMSKEELIQKFTVGEIQILQAEKYIVYKCKYVDNKSQELTNILEEFLLLRVCLMKTACVQMPTT